MLKALCLRSEPPDGRGIRLKCISFHKSGWKLHMIPVSPDEFFACLDKFAVSFRIVDPVQ